jgi:hypothetical protein
LIDSISLYHRKNVDVDGFMVSFEVVIGI